MLHDVTVDPHTRPLRMVLEVDYPDMATIETAQASPLRTEAKAETEKLMTMFDSLIHHVIFEPKASGS